MILRVFFVELREITEDVHQLSRNQFIMTLTDKAAEEIMQFRNVQGITKIVHPKDDWSQHLFPHDSNFKWNEDNYGPLLIPKRGMTVSISRQNIALYERIIDVFEDNDLQIKGDKIFINGEETDQYTFKMDYYWMMGDNRHNSADSRFWGFVPEDHVVGKAIFVWFSMDKNKSLFGGKIRWNKLFRIIR